MYTGDGKGKTTAALGLCIRAAGAGLRVYIAQFMKKGDYSEFKALERFQDQIRVEQFGTGRFVGNQPQPDDLASAGIGMAAAEKALTSGRFDLVVLDEANVAAARGLIEIERLLDLIRSRPAGVELVLTGRGADPRILDAADLVTEMRAVRHYYDDGVEARTGIEK
ncbi:MAG: cob(I)yrinic acid a,c-diamide adenosyltransferase [Desulfobacterales bacterium]